MDTQDAMGLLAIIAASAAPLLESEISSSDTSSSDEDDEVDTIPPASPRKLPKSRHYFDLVNNMDESEFRSHFRLGFDSLANVIDMVKEGHDSPLGGTGLSEKEKTLITLYFLANNASYRQVSQQFGVAMSTAHDTVREVVAAIIAKMGEIITLPSDMHAIKAVADGFGVFGFPNVYGAIDGSSIKVIVPASVKGNYYTRKHITAINLTAMCDSKKRFLDINCGNSERCHDAHIFQTSELGRKVLAEKIIPEQYHIIGDAAYGLHINILTPYKSEENAIQKRYNHLHSSTRMAVERVFGDLKNRWRCLSGLECSVDFSKEIVAVCCILHNICIENNDIQPTDKPITPGSGNVVIPDCSTGKAKRDFLATML